MTGCTAEQLPATQRYGPSHEKLLYYTYLRINITMEETKLKKKKKQIDRSHKLMHNSHKHSHVCIIEKCVKLHI